VLAVVLVTIDLRVVANATSETFAFSLLDRVMLAARSVWFYLATTLWPSELIPVYPRWSLDRASVWYWIPMLAGIVVVGALAAFRRPSTNVALLLLAFFTVTLGPVLGLVDFSYMNISFVADRYLYLASIGPIVGVAVLLTKVRWPLPMGRLGQPAFLVLLATLGTLTWQQSQLYRDEPTFYRGTLERNPDAWLAHINLGPILERQGRLDEAIAHYSAALALKPDVTSAHFNLGVALSQQGRLPEATNAFEAAIRLKPNDEDAHNSLGIVLARSGRFAAAIREYERAIAIKPDFADAENNLGVALMTIGRGDVALRHFERALAIRPAYPQAHINLADALRSLGRTAEAEAHYRAAEAIVAAGGGGR
jgi:tetratricopeptide (TPR) repeat protein